MSRTSLELVEKGAAFRLTNIRLVKASSKTRCRRMPAGIIRAPGCDTYDAYRECMDFYPRVNPGGIILLTNERSTLAGMQ
jgi:hypothetical protein